MSTVIVQYVTLTCDSPECQNTVTFEQTEQAQKEAVNDNPWMNGLRFINLPNGVKLGYCSDKCEADGIKTGSAQRPSPSRAAEDSDGQCSTDRTGSQGGRTNTQGHRGNQGRPEGLAELMLYPGSFGRTLVPDEFNECAHTCRRRGMSITVPQLWGLLSRLRTITFKNHNPVMVKVTQFNKRKSVHFIPAAIKGPDKIMHQGELIIMLMPNEELPTLEKMDA